MRKILSRDNIFLAVAMAAVSSGCKDVPVPPAPVTVATLPPPPRGMPTSDDSTSNPALIVVDEPKLALPGAGTATADHGPLAWEAAFQRALGPQPVWTPPAPPWPECATELVRRPLKAEHKRREDAARTAFKRELDNWNRTALPIRNAAAAGFFVSPPPANAPIQDKVPAGASAIRGALGAVGPTTCVVRDIRPASQRPDATETKASKATGQPLSGPSAYHILCESPTSDQRTPTFLVTVPSRFVAARVEGSSILSWRFEPEGHFAPELRGRVAAIGVGETLELSGIGRLSRGVRDPGFGWRAWRGTEWAVDFNRSCPHEGDDCPFNDGQPSITIRPTAPQRCSDKINLKTNKIYKT